MKKLAVVSYSSKLDPKMRKTVKDTTPKGNVRTVYSFMSRYCLCIKRYLYVRPQSGTPNFQYRFVSTSRRAQDMIPIQLYYPTLFVEHDAVCRHARRQQCTR